jgi:hypothetical protein
MSRSIARAEVGRHLIVDGAVREDCESVGRRVICRPDLDANDINTSGALWREASNEREVHL